MSSRRTTSGTTARRTVTGATARRTVTGATARRDTTTGYAAGVADLLASSYTFTRTSARTHPTTGAEVATGVEVTGSVTEIVPKGITVVTGTDGYRFLGEHPDGRYIYVKTGATYASDDGVSGFTQIYGSAAWRVTPAGTLLLSSPQPTTITRVPGPDYDTATAVFTMNRGFPASGGVSGTSVSWASSGMNWASDGDTLWISEYGGTDIKNTNDPPRTLWRSDDDGVTWVQAYQWSALSGTHCHAIYYDPTTGNLYASIGDGDSATSGIWKSTDRGDSFVRLAPPSGETHTQPTCGMRFGDSIVWGTDTTPTGVWLHNPTTDALEKIPFGHIDSGTGVSAVGVVYYIAVIDGFVVATTAQGTEQFATVWVSDDARTWYRLCENESAEAGWSQTVVLPDGRSFLLKPSQGTAENFIRVAGLEKRTRSTIWTDLATDVLVSTTTPLASPPWVDSATVTFEDGAGPGGMTVAKVGRVAGGSLLSVTPGDVLEFEAWFRNPLGLSDGSPYFEFFPPGSQTQRTVALTGTDWHRACARYTVPEGETGIYIAVGVSGLTFDDETAYYEVAGATVKTVVDAGIETHTRAAESVAWSRTVGSAWGVYDRIWPRWVSSYMETAYTLMTVEDDDTGDTLSVVVTDGVFSLEQTGESDTTGATVRCSGDLRTVYTDTPGGERHTNRQADWLGYGIRVNAGTAELIVWDRINQTLQSYAAPASFAPSTVTITLPASGVEHAPVIASTHLTDGALFNALTRGV